MLKFFFSAFKREQVPLKLAEPLRITRAGYGYGLTVVVDQRVDDYCHTVRDVVGTIIYLLETNVYLDENSDTVASRLIQPNEELFISVDAFAVNGSEHMRSYEPHLRPCFFPEETEMDK